MRDLIAIAILMVACGLQAQSLPTAATSARSVSGQFYITSAPQERRSALSAKGNSDLIQLEPTLVAVSCERIKQAVWRELEYRGSWQHRTVVVLRPARSENDTVTITSERSVDGWNYRVNMPDVLPKQRYLRAMVQVTLLELANRRASKAPADIPVWLTEGIAFHLLCNNGPELLLGSPQQLANGVSVQPAFVEYRRFSELEKAHKILIGRTAPTFDELSWPTPGQFEGPDGPRFQAASQLLICELLKLRGGAECMRNFIAALPNYLNWQMAFLNGFKPHFQRPLDIEKWWTLQAMEFAGRDLTQTWPYEESWHKLAGALVESVEVFTSTNELPKRAEMSLQEILREWDSAKQRETLSRKSIELGALRLRMAPELMQITSDYMQAIDAYLAQTGKMNDAHAAHSRILTGGYRIAESRLLRRLSELDARFKRLQPDADNLTSKLATSNTPVDIAREMRLPAPKLRAN